MSELRRQVFGQSRVPDQEIRARVAGIPRYFFLYNFSGQLPYLYLTDFLRKFSERWFSRPMAELRVLDWGCGPGQVTYLLRSMGAEVVSADRLRDAHDSSFGQEAPFVALDAVVPLEDEIRLPFEDSSFDLVTSFGVLEHVQHPQESLREIQRVLRPRGLFFCYNLPYYRSWIMHLVRIFGNWYHDKLFSRHQVEGLCREAGLDILEMWHRQLFPKNRVPYPLPWLWERLDQFLTERTPLRYLATSLEFVATRR